VEDDRMAMREAGMKAMAENADLLHKEGPDDENGVDIDELLESQVDPKKREAAERAARLAQQNAHLGVGAMARAAYAEIDGRGGGGGGGGGGGFGAMFPR
ncbi:hypothetical protein TeGR_g4553, partial [Tetraparma gracilis]